MKEKKTIVTFFFKVIYFQKHFAFSIIKKKQNRI